MPRCPNAHLLDLGQLPDLVREKALSIIRQQAKSMVEALTLLGCGVDVRSQARCHAGDESVMNVNRGELGLFWAGAPENCVDPGASIQAPENGEKCFKAAVPHGRGHLLEVLHGEARILAKVPEDSGGKPCDLGHLLHGGPHGLEIC
jgi:hypothetical protein